MEEQPKIEPWKLPTMSPSANPIFVSPPRKPRRFDDPTKSPFKDGSLIGYGEVISPLRGRRVRRDEAIPSNTSAFALREELLPILMPANTFDFPSECETAIMSPPNLFPTQLLLQQQLSAMLPANAILPTFPAPQRPDTKKVTSVFDLAIPLRNRRMTSPAEMRHPRPRRMTMSSLPSLQFPFNSHTQPSAATLTVSAPAYQIRNPYDLLEAIQTHPTETFTRIKDLGHENIRLKDEIKFLRNESKFTKDSADIAHKNHSDIMMAHFDKILRYEWCKQNLLHSCIERLENQILQLKGGGRIVQGEWMSKAAYEILEKSALDTQGGVGTKNGLSGQGLGIQGQSNWDELIAQMISTETGGKAKSPTVSNGSGELEDVEGKGKGKEKENLRLRLDPNAQSFVPSVASSPGNSGITEIFSPLPASPGNTAATSPTASNPIPYGPATYASFLHAQHPPSTSSSSVHPPKHRYPSSAPTKPFSSSTTSPIPDAVIDVIQQTLPPLFRRLCPFSLTGFHKCPLESCPMKKLCREFNNDQNQPQYFNHAQNPTETLNGDEGVSFCQHRKCKYAHEYATCVDDLSGANGGIYGKDGPGGKCAKKGKKWKWHGKKRLHKEQATLEEWRVREAVAGLREAHREGRYL